VTRGGSSLRNTDGADDPVHIPLGASRYGVVLMWQRLVERTVRRSEPAELGPAIHTPSGVSSFLTMRLLVGNKKWARTPTSGAAGSRFSSGPVDNSRPGDRTSNYRGAKME